MLKTKLLIVLLALIGLAPWHAAPAETLVEVVLADQLDDSRGFCIDIVGYKQRAKPQRGLQAHSCYSYQGEIGVDQGFDAALIPRGKFRMTGFDLCMTAPEERPGSQLSLKACDHGIGQTFQLTAQGTIVPKDTATLCVTVADGDSTPGGGGQPVHLKRHLTLERCADGRARYQTWRVRQQAD